MNGNQTIYPDHYIYKNDVIFSPRIISNYVAKYAANMQEINQLPLTFMYSSSHTQSRVGLSLGW